MLKPWQKIKIHRDDRTIKKYKLCGFTLLRKEKSPTKKKWNFLGIKVCQKVKVCKQIKPQERSVVFPKYARSYTYMSERKPQKNSRIAIFASFSQDGMIHDYVIYYLKELKKVCDVIIFVADNPIIPSEIEKIKDIVYLAQFERHEEYDFGSYKRGYLYAQRKGLLKDCEELIVCNDSCYGPVYPFKNIFDKMDKKKCDFWGLISNTDVKFHLQSFFYVFKKAVIQSGKVGSFFERVKHENSFWNIVFKYEFEFTDYLIQNGFKCGVYLPLEIPEVEMNVKAGNKNKTVFPLTLIKKYRFPLIKVKCFTNGFTFALEESPESVLDFLKKQNNHLRQLIIKDVKQKGLYQNLYKKDIRQLITESDIVSFDVFDTLLIRPYVNPTDLFKHMEKFYEMPDFYSARIQAEQRARLKNKDKKDVTLKEIYDEILPKFYDMQDKELFFEKSVLRRHPENYKIYQEARKQNKKIVITSDMYLPTEFIADVLKINGYDKIDKIYVSGDCNKTKGSGTLFKQILHDFKCKPNKVLHIGDNQQSDINVPQSLGIKTYYVKKYMDYFNQWGGNLKYVNFFNEQPDIERSIIVSSIARHQMNPKIPYWQDIGYCLGGPLALGYVQKIIKEVKFNNIDCLLFVSRDGYLLQKVYNKLATSPVENHYVYAPRILDLKCFGDYKELSPYFKVLIAILAKQFPQLKKYKDEFAQKQFIKTHNKEISAYYRKEQEEYKAYLDKINIIGQKIASVDMTTGAFSSESFLMKFFKERYCFGFFSASFADNLNYKYITYKQDLIHPQTQEGIIELMELLITAPEFPIIDIVKGQPVYKEKNKFDQQRVDIAKDVERGVIDFIDDYLESFRGYKDFLDTNISMSTIINLLGNYTHILSLIDIFNLKQVYHSSDVANENFISLYEEIIKHN